MMRALSKTEQLRRVLRRGPATSFELARCTGAREQSISALLKYDFFKGRVEFVRRQDAPGVYRLTDAAAQALGRAKALLIAHGYTVSKVSPP